MRVVLPKIGRKSRLTAINTGMWCRQFSRSFIKAPIGAFLFEIYPIIFIMTRKIFLLVFLLFVGCDIDEDIPEHPTGLRGYFTLANGNPRIQITWDESESDDVSEYHIFRAAGLGNSFDLLSTVGSSDSSFTDTTIIWQESFGYKIRAKDQSTNIGDFSDSIFIECYKPSGNWGFPEHDSTTICVQPVIYSPPSTFQLYIGDTLSAMNDTVGVMTLSSESYLDSLDWIGNGWMIYNYTVLEFNEDSTGFDTIRYDKLPEYYLIDLSDPHAGTISFISGRYDTIHLVHTLNDCDGEKFFP